MFSSIHHKNGACLAVAGTATSISLAACGEGSVIPAKAGIQKHASSIKNRESLHLSRQLYKSNIFMQNKANSPSVQDDTSLYITRTYKYYVLKSTPKNKAKQSQNKANFEPKLASVSPILALNSCKYVNITVKYYKISTA